jgi:hypothetical protein
MGKGNQHMGEIISGKGNGKFKCLDEGAWSQGETVVKEREVGSQVWEVRSEGPGQQVTGT